MSPTSDPLWESARQAACQTALHAWEAIAPFYQGRYTITEKVDGPCTEADRLADRLIVEELSARFPAPRFGYLTEESEDRRERLDAEYVWIIDPIDGTKDFIKGNGNFAIHIGLVHGAPTDPPAGAPADTSEAPPRRVFEPVAAAVYRPVAGLMYSAVLGRGSWRQAVTDNRELGPAERLQVSARLRVEQVRSVVSNSHRTSRLMKFIEELPIEDYIHVGSLGVKLCMIAEGEAEMHVNLGLGKTKEWDTCAPHLILEEAGGTLTTLDGNPIYYNREDVYHRRGLLATNGLCHEALVERVRRFLDSEAAAEAAAQAEAAKRG